MIKSFVLLFLLSIPFILLSQKHDAELINKVTEITIVDGERITRELVEIKINNRLGDRFTNIDIHYQDGNYLEITSALIRNNEGVIVRELKDEDIVETNAYLSYSFYSDFYSKTFTLKHNEYPYFIEYSYKLIEYKFIYVAYWFPVKYYNIPTKSALLNITTPFDYNVNISLYEVDNCTIDSLGGNLTYTWETNNIDCFEDEIYSPDIMDIIPHVNVVPVNFKYDKPGSFKTWESFGYWWSIIMEGCLDLTAPEKREIDFLINGLDSDIEKTRILYHYLQDNTRYINVSIETGGLKPYPASYVCHNKYGDCKALSNYFMAVLEYAGITSHYTLINSGDKFSKIDKSIPRHQTNHAIIIVPIDNDTIWLDCTSKGPFGYVGTFIQNREGFAIKGKNSFFSKSPALSMNDVLVERKSTYIYDLNNLSNAEINIVYRGSSFESINEILKNWSDRDNSEYFRELFGLSTYELTEYMVDDYDRDDRSISVTYKASSGNHYKEYGDDLIIKVSRIRIPVFELPAERKLAVQINYPINTKDTLIYKIPIGFEVAYTPSGVLLSNEYGEFSYDFSIGKDEVLMVRSFSLNSGTVQVSNYKKFYEFINKIRNMDNDLNIVMKRK